MTADRVPPGGLPRGFIPGPLDLAAEVISPEGPASEVDAKVQEYLAHGTRLVLVVHPRTRTVTAYRPDGSARVLRSGDSIDGWDIIPGFSLPVDELFSS